MSLETGRPSRVWALLDLAGDPAHAGAFEEMRGRLETWMVETEDPLLEGPVPAVVGAEINARDQLSAGDPTTTVT